MNRPAHDKREVIVATAIRLFAERGFYGTPTSLISQEAGIATGTLFCYFRTKEDLIDAIYREIKADAGEALKKGIEEEPSIRDKLRRVCLNYIDWGIANADKRHFMEQFAHSPFVSTGAHEEGMSNFSFLSGMVEEGIQSGEIRNLHPGLIFHYLAASASGVIDLVSKTRDPSEKEMVVLQGTDLLWNGMGNR